MVIDSHCHVYPDAVAQRAVKGISDFYNGLPNYADGRVDSVKTLYRECNVDHAVIFSVATKASQVQSINDFIAKTIREDEHGFFIGLGTVHQDTQDMPEIVAECVRSGLRGIKIHPDSQRCAIDDKRFFPLYEACCQYNIPVLVHTGDYRYRFSNPDNMEPVLKLFPKTTFIGAHFGGWSMWDQASRRLHGYDNFFVDTSASTQWLDGEHLRKYIRMYGSEKVMLGTDYPMWDVRMEMRRLLELYLKPDEYENIFHGTCQKLYDIIQ